MRIAVAASRESARQQRLLVMLSAVMLVGSFNTSAPLASMLPTLQKAFSTDIATASWTLTSYQLASAALVLTLGRAADLWGHRRLLMAGLAVFAPATAACALAPTISTLIAARAVAGVAAAIMFAVCPALATRDFPPERRGEVLGILLTVGTLGMAGGPLLAGSLIDHFGWQAVFVASVPPGLLALAAVPYLVGADPPASGRTRFDLPGAAALAVGLGGGLLALNEGPQWGWSSPQTLLLVGGSVAALALFVAFERSAAAPMLDLNLFKVRSFAGATACAVANYVSQSFMLVLVPLYLVQGRGFGATEAGLLLGTQPLMRTLVGPLAGKLSDRIGTRLPASVGLLIFAIGLGMLVVLGSDTSLVEITAALLLAGLGTGAFLSPNTSAIMGAIPGSQRGVASGVSSTARNVGIAVGVVLASTIVAVVAGPQPSGEAVYAGTRAGFGLAAVLALLASVVAAVAD